MTHIAVDPSKMDVVIDGNERSEAACRRSKFRSEIRLRVSRRVTFGALSGTQSGEASSQGGLNLLPR